LDRLRIKPNIDVVTELGDAVPDIEIDGPQIRQVFYNLILNAVQAMDKGGDLMVSTRVREAGSKEQGGFIEVSIADTGPGIPEKNLEKIFEPLFSTKVKGTGLGLSVCASLVEGHGGKIEVESEKNKGTVFRVALPIKRG
jgi:signal transduction histidine kinase